MKPSTAYLLNASSIPSALIFLLCQRHVKEKAGDDELAEVYRVVLVHVKLLPEKVHLLCEVVVWDAAAVLSSHKKREGREIDPAVACQLVERLSPLQELIIRVPELCQAVLSPSKAKICSPRGDIVLRVRF